MSRYGEPAGPFGAHPGPSGDPRDPRYEAHEPPSDPWGAVGGPPPPPSGAGPGYPPPGAGPGYPPVAPPPGWDQGPSQPWVPPDAPQGWAPDPHQSWDPAGQGWGPDPGQAGAADPGRAWAAEPEPAWQERGDAEPGGDDGDGSQWDEAGHPPPDGRSNTLLFVAVGVLLLVVVAAVAYALYLLSGDTDPVVAPPPPPPATAPGPTGEATPTPGGSRDNLGLNAAVAQASDCLTNLGTDVEPQLQIVPCDSAEGGPVYQVLARIETQVEGDNRAAQDASAQETCTGTDGYTHHYFEVGESLSFVLCMAERPADPEGADDEAGDEDSEG